MYTKYNDFIADRGLTDHFFKDTAAVLGFQTTPELETAEQTYIEARSQSCKAAYDSWQVVNKELARISPYGVGRRELSPANQQQLGEYAGKILFVSQAYWKAGDPQNAVSASFSHGLQIIETNKLNISVGLLSVLLAAHHETGGDPQQFDNLEHNVCNDWRFSANNLTGIAAHIS